jgi:hypothetical protein
MFDVLDRSQQRPSEIKPVETIVAGTDDFVIASSDPVRIPSQARVPAHYAESLQHAGKIAVAEMDKRAFVRREVLMRTPPIGSIYAALEHRLSARRAAPCHGGVTRAIRSNTDFRVRRP